MDVVFLHGWLMGPDLWDAQVAALDGTADLVEVEGAGHATPMEQPAPVTAAVCALVERVIEAASMIG